MDTFHIVCSHCDTVNRIPASKRDQRALCGKCKRELFEGRPVSLTDGNFEKFVRRNDVPVVVDFWAPWCEPCKMMAPAYERAAAELEPNVRLAKVNTDESKRLAAQYGIRSIPTLAIFKKGKEVARQAGALPVEPLVQWIKAHV